MQTYEHRHVVYLTADDVVDFWVRRRRGTVVDFAVNYRATVDGAPHTIIRYDTCHGQRLHVHRMWRRPKDRITYLERRRRTDYRSAATSALEDVAANWTRYRRMVLRGAR